MKLSLTPALERWGEKRGSLSQRMEGLAGVAYRALAAQLRTEVAHRLPQATVD